jgi:glycosyltransferase involved in cell wall biosynthesis
MSHLSVNSEPDSVVTSAPMATAGSGAGGRLKPPSRILLVSVLPPHGAPEAVHGLLLSEHLADRGVDVHVISQRGAIASEHPRLTVHPIMTDWGWSDEAGLLRAISAIAPDAIVLLFIEWAFRPSYMISFLPSFAKRLLPQVVTVSQFENVYRPAPMTPDVSDSAMRSICEGWVGLAGVDPLYGTLLRDSDRVIVQCNDNLNLLAELSPGIARKAVLKPCPALISLSEEGTESRRTGRRLLGYDDEVYLLAFFGFLYPSKGIETLFEALALAKRKLPQVRLVLIGDVLDADSLARTGNRLDYGDSIRALAAQLQIDDIVKWTGRFNWDQPEPSLYLRAADCCVLPFNDGVRFHNSSFATAALHGLPVITTLGDHVEEAFVHGANAYLCPPCNAVALADAIVAVAAAPELRDELANGARALAEAHFSWAQAVAKTLLCCSRTE